MSSAQRVFAAMAMVALLVACSNEGKVDQSLKSVMVGAWGQVFHCGIEDS